MRTALYWLVASASAVALGGGVGVALGPSDNLILTGFVAMGTGIVAASGFQRLLLGSLLANPNRWLLAGLGSVASMGVVILVVGALDADIGWVLGVVTGWVILGVFQWRILRTEFERAGWWIAANIGGFVAGIPLVAFASWAAVTAGGAQLDGLASWLALGLAYGSVTAAALTWLKQNPLPGAFSQAV